MIRDQWIFAIRRRSANPPIRAKPPTNASGPVAGAGNGTTFAPPISTRRPVGLAPSVLLFVAGRLVTKKSRVLLPAITLPVMANVLNAPKPEVGTIDVNPSLLISMELLELSVAQFPEIVMVPAFEELKVV